MRRPTILLGCAGLLFASRAAHAEGPWIDRPLTLPRSNFSANVGLGIGHAPGTTGAGLNLEAAFGLTSRVELSVRSGVRLSADGRVAQADSYARTIDTETFGTGQSDFANPEVRLRGVLTSSKVFELALEGKVMLPFETGTRFGTTFGVPMRFHIEDVARIDMGAFFGMFFYDTLQTLVSLPASVWFQPSRNTWIGPMVAVRLINPGDTGGHAEFLLGGGFGVAANRTIDIKTQFFFPRITDSTAYWGGGVGLEVHID